MKEFSLNALFASAVKQANDFEAKKAQVLNPNAIAVLSATLEPVADRLDARESFANMGMPQVEPLAGVSPEVQAGAETYRMSRKIDRMMGQEPGTSFKRALVRELEEAYGIAKIEK